MPPHITASAEPVENLERYWQDSTAPLQWECLFLLPPWLNSWLSTFGAERHSEAIVIRDGESIIGIAPVLYHKSTVTLIGSPEVCDYCGLITRPGLEKEFLSSLLDALAAQNMKELTFSGIRQDSALYTLLPEIASSSGGTCTFNTNSLTFGKKLPSSWQVYLEELNGKQRHEVRRKTRRLYEAGEIELLIIESPEKADEACDLFLRLFISSRKDKAMFMDATMTLFFRRLIHAMSAVGMLRLFFLYINNKPAATALCFEYNKTMYLYNSGYDPRFRPLSAGFLCKSMSIQNAIERGCTSYDFLKGSEPYKRRMGGISSPVYQCHLHLR
ncbi:MAG: GNAT family N-acetyltransferase [Desulfobulbaceae bacterium]|uniref:GNAT family N-acetyltransferase n=1 Tax=Candidatus Desulfobia pelagia TaxID=2841692 RepID=A0A8J6NFL0_9BACT|nr:GNAT family N-acetyltransferase [Candidatus Desulfobia pelagia]